MSKIQFESESQHVDGTMSSEETVSNYVKDTI